MADPMITMISGGSDVAVAIALQCANGQRSYYDTIQSTTWSDQFRVNLAWSALVMKGCEPHAAAAAAPGLLKPMSRSEFNHKTKRALTRGDPCCGGLHPSSAAVRLLLDEYE